MAPSLQIISKWWGEVLATVCCRHLCPKCESTQWIWSACRPISIMLVSGNVLDSQRLCGELQTQYYHVRPHKVDITSNCLIAHPEDAQPVISKQFHPSRVADRLNWSRLTTRKGRVCSESREKATDTQLEHVNSAAHVWTYIWTTSQFHLLQTLTFFSSSDRDICCFNGFPVFGR